MTVQDKPKTAVEAASRIRADIKQAVKDGSLGDIPAGIKFRVWARRGGLSPGVWISIREIPWDWAFGKTRSLELSAAGKGLALAVRDILGKHWHGTVDVDGQIAAGC